MKTTQPDSRPTHIAELTRGCSLPLEPIVDAHLSVILETLSLAWHELGETNATALNEGDEAEVNALLEPRLNHFCQTKPMWKDLVSSVSRGRESMSYNGAKLEARPDLTLVLTRRTANFPLVVECKIIDKSSGKGVGLYCTNGIDRYVSGDYAWAGREAIMLAYVRDGSTIEGALCSYLVKSAKLNPDPFQTSAFPQVLPQIHQAACFSKHLRKFSYLGECGGAEPGEIALAHLWFGRIKSVIAS